MKLIIGNWKANKDITEVKAWIKEFKSLLDQDPNLVASLGNKVKVAVCPPFPFFIPLQEAFVDYKIEVGAQTVSVFGVGSYTGNVPAALIKDLVDFVIIGHAERRRNDHETTTEVNLQIEQSQLAGIVPIVCICNQDDFRCTKVNIYAYEPQAAIGTGDNADPDHVIDFRNRLHLDSNTKFLYGGSVNVDNCASYLNRSEIDGLLIGKASLDPRSFFKIVKIASEV